MSPVDPDLIRILTGQQLVDATPLSGGDIGSVTRLELMDGRVLVAKQPRPGGADTARNEALMLHALSQHAPAPPVVAAQPELLLLDYVPHDRGDVGAEVDMARHLASLHNATAPQFGFDQPTYFAGVLMENDWLPSWPEFLRRRRLEPMIALARKKGQLPDRLYQRLSTLLDKLTDLLHHAPTPSLVHGDLWQGNVLLHGNRLAAFIDPAVYYADAEVDLAMLTLFGAPSPAFWDTYDSLRAPAPGRQKRRGLYLLFPLLFHLQAFGNSYLPAIERVLDEHAV